MTKCIMVLGFDRVGKTSLINRSIELLGNPDSILVKHWTAPKNRKDPFKQYNDFLEQDFSDFDYVICDRGFPETYFYEHYRMKNDSVMYIPVIQLIERFRKKFIDFHIVIIKQDWGVLIPRHLEELENGINNTVSGESETLDGRLTEYCAYYRFMEKFYKAHTYVCEWRENSTENYLEL